MPRNETACEICNDGYLHVPTEFVCYDNSGVN